MVLGNTFSLGGYIISENKKEEKILGKIQYLINLLSFIVAIMFFAVNIYAPSLIFQMAANLLLMIGFIQMIPMKPFSGRLVRRWNKRKWSSFYFVMFVVYTFVNLIIFM